MLQGFRDLGYVSELTVIVVRGCYSRDDELPKAMDEFVRLEVDAIVAGPPVIARAAGGKVYRVHGRPFLRALGEWGYVEGRNLVLEWRGADDHDLGGCRESFDERTGGDEPLDGAEEDSTTWITRYPP